MPYLISTGTAVPPYAYEQHEIRDSARQHFDRQISEIERLIDIFDSVQVRRRFFCVPLEWFAREHSFSDKNQEYVRWAERLSLEAIERCLNKAGIEPAQIDHLVFVSSSGISTPSIDARLMNRLGFRPQTKRTPIFGLGCAGGAAGFSLCSDLARGSTAQYVLLVCVELSSLTFQSRDYRKSNLVASALFSDGAAALLISADARGRGDICIVDTMSTLWPNTLEVMGWDFSERGLTVILSRDIPAVIRKHIRSNIQDFLDRNAMTLEDLSHYAIHPGGAKILAALQQLLGLTGDALCPSACVLENYGNMSSPTVLFILEHLIERRHPRAGEYGLCAAFGPGFSSELVLLRW